jgi:exosome complex RNA-binding protein Rrp42 (RNase PH superfamily)
VDTHVLDHGGNLVDACCLSALAALMAFRKPEVTVGGASGTEVIVHPPEVKEPLPLTIHHLPVSVTFGVFDVSGCRCRHMLSAYVFDPDHPHAHILSLPLDTSGWQYGCD